MNDTMQEFGDGELRALLRRVALRDKSAFRAFYHALYPKLSRYLLRLLRHADDADDLINDVMWVVWEKAGEFRGEAQVATWVLGIATFKSYRWLQQARRRQLLLNEQLAMPALESQADYAHDNGHDELLALGMAQLSDEHRETLELAYFFGYSCEEISHLMACPVGTVKTRLYHARKRLRNILEASGFTLSGDQS